MMENVTPEQLAALLTDELTTHRTTAFSLDNSGLFLMTDGIFDMLALAKDLLAKYDIVEKTETK